MAKHFPEIESRDFDWNDLKYALAVARHGGLSQAAKILGSSASTVARHIQQLEAALGHTLFLRQQTGYLLTDEGKEVLELIINVEDALLALERRDAGSGSCRQVSGYVRLACAEMMAVHLVTPHLPKLFELHPQLQVDLAVDIKLVDLNRREADVALRLANPGEKPGEQDYIAHAIGKMTFAAYRSRRHEDTKQYVSWGKDWEHLPMAQWLKQHFKTQEPRLLSNNANVQLQAARAGVGLAVLPRFIGDADPDLMEVSICKTELSRNIWLVYHRDLKASTRVLAMKDFLSDCVQDYLK
ncbi:LysR family transcriptional regulator [Undibacterium sp. TJN19]|uniref:LysR family transcriptional regulator n=1 Tax=Undibacterium sp. TJN19 TaxID=3413055 RepID=UPI003BF12186